MRIFFKYKILIILCLFLVTYVSAQPGRGLNRGNITRLYDTSTVETITGKILKIDTVQSGYGRFPGILVTLKTEKQETKIYTAPSWYLDEQKIKFNTGDSLSVTGSRVTFQDKPLIITKEFNYHNKKNIIREENGTPVWAGKRMGPGKGRKGRRR